MRIHETMHTAGTAKPPHRHDIAYAAIVMDGSYDEISADAAVRAQRGDIVVHPPFHAHTNSFQQSAAKVLNIALPPRHAASLGYRIFHSSAAGELCTLARRDPRAAAMGIIEEAASSQPPGTPSDWLAVAVMHMRDDPSLSAFSVARAHGKTPEHLSRACKARYGVGPAGLRAEYRFRTALSAILDGIRPADAAALAGYADQSHLTHECVRITGKPPARLIRDIKLVQDVDDTMR